MLLHPHHLIAKSRCGFALISVLALVSLAALTATAFLASARLERQATLPMGNIVRLDWALASAEKCAEQTIGDGFEPTGPKNFVTTLWRGTNTDDWTNEVGYLLIGRPNATNSVKWTYYAGFSPSGMTNLSTNVIGLATTFSNTHQGTFLQDCGGYFSSQGTNGFAAKPLATNPICTTIDLLGGQTSPPVGWVYITQRKRPLGSSNEVTSPVARVAWFIEDLAGKIDAENMGALSGNRSTGTNPEEICLTSMTRTNGTPIFSGTTNLMTNATNRKLFFTPGLLANQAISGLTNSDDLRYFATGLREFRPINKAGMNGMLDWIPGGIPVAIVGTSTNPYANSGSSKLNINQLIALTYPSNVQSIASVISNNLPNFASIRAGGFTNSSGGGATNTNAYSRGAYYLTLAANIVDYADTDSTPTTDGTALSTNRIRPVYRGVDSYPFVNEIVKRYLLTSTSPMTVSGIKGLGYRVETTDYFELWNLSSQSTQPGTLTFLAVHGQPATLGFSNISFDKPLWASNSSGPISNGITSNSLTVPAIPPNGFTTLACTTTTNLFFYGSVTNPPVFSLEQELTNSRYFVAWNGVYYDAALRGIKRNNGSLPLGTPRNRGNLPSFTYGTSSGVFTNPAVGDPRATIYLSQVLDNNQYIGNATFGGRNVRAEGSIATTKEYYEVTPNRWPDGGHNSPKGSSPTSDNQIPTSFAPINTNLPPGRISNTGSLSNICELGGVFDPIQWADPSLGGWEGKWTNLSISASNNNTFGGGTSLRIGRAEHGKFAFTNFAGNSTPSIPNMGGSAAALLDLFCVTNGNTGGGPFRTGGKINLNTAPAPVLRALAGGILLTNDPSQSPKNAAVPAGMAEAFAQGVMRFRSKYPFLTPSHLSFIGTDPAWPNTNNWPNNSVFGNTNTISLSTAPGNTFGTSASVNISEWNDQAAGEWFSKIYNLSTVQSDNYRVYIVAQLVDTNKLPTSPLMRKYVQFAGRPDTPATGAVNATNIYGGDMWSWNLTKGLKKVYESPY